MTRDCASCGKKINDGSITCPGCGWQNSGKGPKPIVKAVARPKIQVIVQCGMTIDRTGSSGAFRDGIPLTAAGILTPIAAKALDVKVWLQTHGDLDENQQVILLGDGISVEEAINEVKKVEYDGGGGPEETHLDAIETLLDTVPWANNPHTTRGAIVGMMTADTKPARSGVSASELGERIKQQGVLFYLVCEPTPTLQELSDAADGMLFEISNTPDASELQKIAGQISASIVATVRSGSTVPIRTTP
jgi:hypothetical protein